MKRWQVTIYMGVVPISSRQYRFRWLARAARWIASPPNMRLLFSVRAEIEEVRP